MDTNVCTLATSSEIYEVFKTSALDCGSRCLQMVTISEKKAIELLGNASIAGSAEQRVKLFTRIGELVAINGEQWVRENRDRLLREWETIVKRGYLDKH